MLVFICTGNWYRSRFAAAYARHLGLRAISRGLDIDRIAAEDNDLTPIFGNTRMSMPAYRYLKTLGVSDDIIAVEESPTAFDMESDWLPSSVCIALYHKEHKPMLENHPVWNQIAHRIMYWDIQDYPKQKGQKGFEDNLGGCNSEVTLPQIKDKIDRLFL